MNFYPKRRRKPEVIIVSLIDIFAILLIFMVMTTQFKDEKGAFTIKLPESKTAAVAEKQERKTVILNVTESEALYLDDKEIKIDDLKAALGELLRQSPQPVLALNADKKAPFGVIVRVLDVLKESGVKGNLSAFTEIKK